jgi:hypothetical protein
MTNNRPTVLANADTKGRNDDGDDSDSAVNAA